MSKNVIFLHRPPSPVAHFIRAGASNHRQLQHLRAAGKMPMSRFVFNAGMIRPKVFIENDLVVQDRIARQCKSLKVDDHIKKLLEKSSVRLDRARAIVERLQDANLRLSRYAALDVFPNQEKKSQQDKKQP